MPGLDFDLSLSSIMASLVFSAVGWWLYREGKRLGSTQNVIFGWLLMLYSYFTPTSKHAWVDWATGFAICGVAYYFRNQEIL